MHEIESAIARLQGNLQDMKRRQQEYRDQELWNALSDILPAKRICETLLEYAIQECDWFWDSGDLPELWATSTKLRTASPGQIITLCISLALPAFMLRQQPSSIYPLPPLGIETEMALAQLAREIAQKDPIVNVSDINGHCDLCTYVVYSRAINEVPAVVERYEAAAKVLGLLDETHPSWLQLSDPEREWRRHVAVKVVVGSRVKQMYTNQDDLSDVRINFCLPDLRAFRPETPVNLDIKADGGQLWPNRNLYQPPSQFTDASELRMLRFKLSGEVERSTSFKRCFYEATDILPAITRIRSPVLPPELQSEMALTLYHDLLQLRDVRTVDLGLSDAQVTSLDASQHISRRLISQILVIRSVIAQVISYLLRPWLLSAGSILLDVTSNPPTLHGRLALAALENAEFSMKCIPMLQEISAYPQINVIGAFISASLFNAATALAVPVLRSVQLSHAASSATPYRSIVLPGLPALPVWPNSFNSSRGVIGGLDGSQDQTVIESSTHISHWNSPANMDGTVRKYADRILLCLETLSLLKGNYLGHEAEQRLRVLISSHNIRGDSHTRADEQDSAGSDNPLASHYGVATQAMDARLYSDNAEGVMDLAWLDELLSLDVSVWDTAHNATAPGDAEA